MGGRVVYWVVVRTQLEAGAEELVDLVWVVVVVPMEGRWVVEWW